MPNTQYWKILGNTQYPNANIVLTLLSMFLMFFIKVKKHVFYVFYLQVNVFNIYGLRNRVRVGSIVKVGVYYITRHYMVSCVLCTLLAVFIESSCHVGMDDHTRLFAEFTIAINANDCDYTDKQPQVQSALYGRMGIPQCCPTFLLLRATSVIPHKAAGHIPHLILSSIW